MKASTGGNAVPPWGFQALWDEANASLARMAALHAPALGQARAFADLIRRELEAAAPLVEALCAQTCSSCPEPCCLHAKVWLDFKDLLYLHLSGLPVPELQLRESMEGPCRCLGPGGCTLDRGIRPFACFWYYCPAQKTRLASGQREIKQRLEQAVANIKAWRTAMEDAFISITI